MQRFVIIEGLDRCGKDTQILRLIKHFWEKENRISQMVHFSKLPFETVEKQMEYALHNYSDMFQMMIETKNSYRNFIFNRAHLGETVYSPLYRGYSCDFVFDIEEEYLDKVEDKLYLFVLVNDPEILITRDDGNGFSKSVEDIEREKVGFERAFKMSKIKNKKLIFCGNQSIDEIHKSIVDYIK